MSSTNLSRGQDTNLEILVGKADIRSHDRVIGPEARIEDLATSTSDIITTRIPSASIDSRP
jgi:hypothetical protein